MSKPDGARNHPGGRATRADDQLVFSVGKGGTHVPGFGQLASHLQPSTSIVRRRREATPVRDLMPESRPEACVVALPSIHAPTRPGPCLGTEGDYDRTPQKRKRQMIMSQGTFRSSKDLQSHGGCNFNGVGIQEAMADGPGRLVFESN